MYTEPAAVYGIPCIVEECWRSQGISNKKRRARPARWTNPDNFDRVRRWYGKAPYHPGISTV